VLSLQDSLRCSTRESIRWRHCKFSALRVTNFGRTYKNQKFFLGHRWQVSQETHLVVLKLLRTFSTRRSMSKRGTGKDYLLHYLRSPTKSTFKCLCKQTQFWQVVMSKSLRNPEDQDDCKKGMLSDQPRLTRVTPTVLIGSWLLQPIKDLTSLGTDFERHAKWQKYIEEPAAKDFVARKVRTIAWSQVQGTHWNVIKCQEHLGNHSEAVIRQATIDLDSWVWKSLGNSLPKLYCVDLAEAYVTQESVSLRILCEKRGYDLQLPNGRLHEKPSAKGKTGKEIQN
jgi:hypothetical protein